MLGNQVPQCYYEAPMKKKLASGGVPNERTQIRETTKRVMPSRQSAKPVERSRQPRQPKTGGTGGHGKKS
jgi:hypothetical protein